MPVHGAEGVANAFRDVVNHPQHTHHGCGEDGFRAGLVIEGHIAA